MDKEKLSVLEIIQKQDDRLGKIESLLSLSKPVFNIDELCQFTGLSKSKIYKCSMLETISHYKKLKHLIFDREEIIVWLKEKRVFNINEIEASTSTALTLNKKGVKA
jgi:predicted DNA-binding transcriptional regulator AlpA